MIDQFLDIVKERFVNGGPVMWPILAVSLFAWYFIFERFFFFKKIYRQRQWFFTQWEISTECKVRPSMQFDNSYKILFYRLSQNKRSFQKLMHFYREFILDISRYIDNNFSFIQVLISAAPLLGLLGTVMGMMRTFNTIVVFVVGNPHLMADGISVALLTTQAGLTVAFPAMLAYNHLVNVKRNLYEHLMGDENYLVEKLTLLKNGSNHE